MQDAQGPERLSPEASISFAFCPRTEAMHAGPPAYAVVRRMCVLCATKTSSSSGRKRSAMMRCTLACKVHAYRHALQQT